MNFLLLTPSLKIYFPFSKAFAVAPKDTGATAICPEKHERRVCGPASYTAMNLIFTTLSQH